MVRPILDTYSQKGVIDKEVLTKWRTCFDDDQILCFVLVDYFKLDIDYVAKRLSLDSELVSNSYHKIFLFNHSINVNDSPKTILTQMIEQKIFSNEFLDILLEQFDERQILIYVLKEFMEFDNEMINVAIKTNDEEIDVIHQEVKKYVDDMDMNIDPLEIKTTYVKSAFINPYIMYNGPRFSNLTLPWEDEDVSPDWGYLDDIPNDGF